MARRPIGRLAALLGHVRGALLVAAAQRGLPIAEYSPREVKLAVTGNGGAAKEQVAFMVRRVLGMVELPGADAADALAGAVCHLNRARNAGRPGDAAPATPAALRLRALLAKAQR